MTKLLMSKWTKAAVFGLCLVPLGVLIWQAFQGDLTANPIEFVEHTTGDWTIRFIVITLAITPLREILKQPQLIRFRRMLGLFAFFYGFLHFGTWIGIDNFFAWHDMAKDIAKRPFVTVGFAAFVLMIPLAITSTKGMVRRLGFIRWQRLHRLIYATAILAVFHYYWLVKSDVRRPVRYGVIVAALLLWRLGTWRYGQKRAKRQGAVSPHRESAKAPPASSTVHTLSGSS